jgi:hypothetical protein
MVASVHYVNLRDALDHVVAIEQEIMTEVAAELALPDLDTQEALVFGRYESGVYPKWLNDLPTATSEWGGSQEEIEHYTVNIELQLGKRTEGYEGDLEIQKLTWIPLTLAYFRQRPILKCTTKPTGIVGLLGSSIRIGQVRVPNSGDIIACSFNLTLDTAVSNEERDF